MRLFTFAVLLLSLGASVQASEPGASRWCWPWSPSYCSCPRCPDDYCSKPMPPIPCAVHCFGPDDYCPKKLPIVCFVKCFGVNDYCPKACPVVQPLCCPASYSCGRPQCDCPKSAR